MFQPVTAKPSFPELEERILWFWKERRIFEQSLEQRRDAPLFVLYDGPPTANARPGIHHVLSRVFKDIFPRYKTMKGYCAPRKAGWDTHGLPVELGVEEELGFSSKSQIEAYGVDRFNSRCRQSVFRYVKDWELLTERIGFWLDMEHPYITLDNSYIESCWWLVKQLWERGLIYQGYKVTPHCPRCGTSLSSHEVALGYRDDTPDPSVYIKFRLIPKLPASPRPGVYQRLYTSLVPTYFLAWTTTPWTLPGNTALAVAPEAEYAVVECGVGNERERLILAQALVRGAINGECQVVDRIAGEELIGLEYEPLFKPADFDVPAERLGPGDYDQALGHGEESPQSYPVIGGDFVSLDEGTGIVHIAPAFGDVDYEAGQAQGLWFVQNVDLQGNISGTFPFAGKFVKDADEDVIADLESRNLLYRRETIHHTYPFCWRCETPLLYYAKTSWYIKTTAVKDRLISGNLEINWYPDHIKYGRFGDWLENNVDWAFSRERYWGTPLPIWRCESCGQYECVGSLEELKRRGTPESILAMALEGSSLDLHRPFVDGITFPCPCGGVMRRVPEVLDCWFDSGAMPFAQWHYPFENETLLSDGRFPADYISEAIDQTRGWFYSLHALSVLLLSQPCFRNVICLGHILDSKGEKMSKSKGNVIDPWEVLNRYGADALRWYLITATAPGNVRRFAEDGVGEALRRFLSTLWNTYSFFVTYANIDRFDPKSAGALGYRSELDRWILGELNQLIDEVTQSLESYDPTRAGRRIGDFVDNLSNWYVRRSRRRFWKSENDADKQAAHATLYHCLVTLAKLLAPLTPFIAEELYQNLVRSVDDGAPQSVHLTDFPVADRAKIDEELIAETQVVMKVASLGRNARSKASLKVRQPLAKVLVKVKSVVEKHALERLGPQLLDELNVRGMVIVPDEGEFVDFEVRPNFSLLGPRYGDKVAEIAAGISGLKPQEVAREVSTGRGVLVSGYSLLPEEVFIEVKAKPGYAVAMEGGYVVGVTTEISPELADEGLARELVHRLQMMRRSAGFDIADYIETYYQGDPSIQRVMTGFADYIRQETLSRRLAEGAPPGQAYVESHRVAGEKVVLGVRKLE